MATCGQAPEGIDAPVQYGPRITAIIVYLYVGQFLSKKRTAQALAELFGTPVSDGSVAAMTARAAEGLDEFAAEIADRLAEAEVVGFDETGLRVQGRLHWVHCARTDKYTLVGYHPKRGTARMDDLGVLGRFRGIAVHDAWHPTTPTSNPNTNCVARTRLRELQAVTDTVPDSDGDWCWATRAAEAGAGRHAATAASIDLPGFLGRSVTGCAATAREIAVRRCSRAIPSWI